MHFNPLPPHGGRRCRILIGLPHIDFNPLPPHGGRRRSSTRLVQSSIFQSTPSAWRETLTDVTGIKEKNFNPLPPHGGRQNEIGVYEHYDSISIHSLRMEGDSDEEFQALEEKHFNPLPPHGGRHEQTSVSVRQSAFQSTPSAWRETLEIHTFFEDIIISIHSLRMEGDPQPHQRHLGRKDFNPLPPHGGRPPYWQ